MRNEILTNISKIIERESKSTTYKFALLRSTIDVIQENSPFIEFSEEKVKFPTGLLVEKWLLYYYPIIESAQPIPQIHGNNQLAFAKQFKQITDFYSQIGGFSTFYNDLRNKGIPPLIQDSFLELIDQIKNTITRMPMRYIGNSINEEHYSIFKPVSEKTKITSHTIDTAYLIVYCSSFLIPREYYEAFKLFGSFISGKNSILFKWAEFSVNASKNLLSMGQVLNGVLRSPITERDVAEAKKVYKQVLDELGTVYCVWSGEKISVYDIDHMIPFSAWKNNDLWNLLPATPKVNSKKRDKIPSFELLNRRKELIFHYWDLLESLHPTRFYKEIAISLIGGSNARINWKECSFENLQTTCKYLIDTRGFPEWDLSN